MPRAVHSRRVPEKDRIRVSRACTACRSRKSRCMTRAQGACQRCEATGQICVFMKSQIPIERNPEKHLQRRTSEGPFQVPIRGETLENPSRSTYDGQVTDVDCSSPLGMLSSATKGRGISKSLAESRVSHRESESAQQTLQESDLPIGELEGAILLVENPGRTQYTGLRSNESFLLCVRDVLNANSEKGSTGVETPNLDKSSGTASPLKSQSKEVATALQEFPPQEIGLFLVSTFFYYVEATFFYCDREWFHRTLASVYAGNYSVEVVDDAFVCLALLVFAFGSQFAHLRSNPKSTEPLPAVLDPGKRLYDVAQALIPRIIAKCTLKGIQVCLLAGLYNLPSNLHDTSYLYLGMAVRMSVASGLHRKTLAAGLDPRLREVRNRLWWSVYCIDRRASIALGRPASIAEDDVDAPYPKYHPLLDDLEYQSNVQHQVEYIKLTRIVNQIMQNIASPLESKPSCISDLTEKLNQWRSQLFSNLHPNDLLPSERNFRTTVHLHIHYHWAWIRMGRASLLQLSKERLLALTGSLPNVDQPQSRLDLSRLCVDAAKATIQLILILKKHNLLCRFSFTDHQAPTAALIILVLHSILQYRVDTSTAIDDGVEMLRFMATGGCRGAKSDLQTIEQFRAFAVALRQRIYQGEVPVQTKTSIQPASTTTADSYCSWAKWMSEREGLEITTSSTELLQATPITEPPIRNTASQGNNQRIELYTSQPNNTSLTLFHSNDYFAFDQPNLISEFSMENVSNLQPEAFRGDFGWDNGRLDMLDITQLLTESCT